MFFLRGVILTSLVLLVQPNLHGQSKRTLYSIAAHFGNIPRMDILVCVQSGRHQISGGYVASIQAHIPEDVTVPGLNFGYRFYPGRLQKKVNGFLSVDLFFQSYKSSTFTVDNNTLIFGGGFRYFPIPRLYLDLSLGLGPGWYESWDANNIYPSTPYSYPQRYYGSGRVGVGFRFN